MSALPYSQVQQNARLAMQRIIAKPSFQALPPEDQQLFRQWGATGDAPPRAAAAIDRAVKAGVIPNGPSALREFGTAGLLALGLTAIPAAGGVGVAAPEGGETLAANLGPSSALPAFGGGTGTALATDAGPGAGFVGGDVTNGFSANGAPAATSGLNLSGALKGLAPLAGLIGGHFLQQSQQNNAVPPQLNDLLTQALARIKYQNPLFQAASQQAFLGLPDYARQGIKPPGSF